MHANVHMRRDNATITTSWPGNNNVPVSCFGGKSKMQRLSGRTLCAVSDASQVAA